MTYALLEALLPHFAAFEANAGSQPAKSGDALLETFVDFLQQRQPGWPIPTTATEESNLAADQPVASALDPRPPGPLVTFAILLARLGRYARAYGRLALANKRLGSIEEFGLLASAHQLGPIRRKDLIEHQAFEKSGGTELINRLVKRGLLTNRPNPKDARSKLIEITSLGLQELKDVHTEMTSVVQVLVGDLKRDELDQLLLMLKRLEHFHYIVYQAELSDLPALQAVLQRTLEK